MSGESLRLMIERAGSGNTVVATWSGDSSSNQPSCSNDFVSVSKRPGGFDNAPRPLSEFDIDPLYLCTVAE